MIRWTLAILLCAVVPAMAQQAHQHDSGPKVPSAHAGAPVDYSRFVYEMRAAMNKMMSGMHAPGYEGNPDIDFLGMMIAHHEGAVEMARLELTHGTDPATRRLADDIIASQSVEIESMKRRLATLRSGKGAEPDAFPELGGTRGRGK